MKTVSFGSMWYCAECGQANNDDAARCANCGAPREGDIRCPACGAKMASNMAFCPSCGKKLGEAKTAPAAKSGINKKIAALGGLIAVLVIAIVVVVAVGGKNQPEEENNVTVLMNEQATVPETPEPTVAVTEEPKATEDVAEPREPEEEEPLEEFPEDVSASPEELPTEEETVKEPFEYSEWNGKITIEKYNGTDTVVVIPEEIDGKPIVKVTYSAFKENLFIEKVTVPATVEYIGSNAFEKCSALEEVVLLGETSVFDEAFKNCTSLKTISAITSVNDEAFMGCSSLESITVNGYGSIDENAFKDCVSLKKVEFGAKVTSCDATAFDGCTALSEIIVSEDNEYLDMIGDVLYGQKRVDSEDGDYYWTEKVPIISLSAAEHATKRTESSLPLTEVYYAYDGKMFERTEYIYDTSGNLMQKNFYSRYNSNYLKPITKTNYTYDDEGNLLREDTDDNNFRYSPGARYKEYTYDSNDLLIEVVSYDGKAYKESYEEAYEYDYEDTTYEYDNSGNLIKQTYYHGQKESNLEGSAETHTWEIETYDSNGNLLTYTQYGGPDAEVFYQERTYEYDNEGREIYYHYIVGVDAKISGAGRSGSERYEYDSSGNRVKTVGMYDDGTNEYIVTYEYDSNNRLMRSWRYDDYGTGELECTNRTVYKRDANGNIVEYLFYHGDSEDYSHREVYTYDERGNQLTYQTLGGPLIERTFDANNNMLSETTYDLEEPSKIAFAEYWTYDEYGNALTYKYVDSDGGVGKRMEYTYIYFD